MAYGPLNDLLEFGSNTDHIMSGLWVGFGLEIRTIRLTFHVTFHQDCVGVLPSGAGRVILCSTAYVLPGVHYIVIKGHCWI